MHELVVGPGVDPVRDVEASSRPAAASAALSASGNDTPWWSISRAPPCSRPAAQATPSSSSRCMAPQQRAAMPSRSSVNQRRCSSSPAPTPPMMSASVSSTPAKRIVGWPCG